MGWVVRPCHFLLISAVRVFPGGEVRRVVAPERDYSPYNIKDIDRPVILERMISAPGKSRPAQVPGLQHSRNIVAPATFRPT